MHTLRYWMVEEKDYPYQNIFIFVRNNKELDYEPFYKTFFDNLFIEQIKMLINEDIYKLYYISCRYGYLLLLQYVHKNRYYRYYTDIQICNEAAENGHLDCLKYTHKNSYPWDKETCRNAAENGYLDCLQYAHENGCPWDKKTCEYGAVNGHIECLQYAHETGCLWNKNNSENGQLVCLHYVRLIIVVNN